MIDCDTVYVVSVIFSGKYLGYKPSLVGVGGQYDPCVDAYSLTLITSPMFSVMSSSMVNCGPVVEIV